jgi:hypothetical protein
MSTIMPIRLLSICTSPHCFSEFVVSISMSYLQLWYVQK